MSLQVLLAPDGFENELEQELKFQNLQVLESHARLFLIQNPKNIKLHWAQVEWLNAERTKVESISQAAKLLQSKQRNWSLYSFDFHRRAALIQESLPKISKKHIEFLAPSPQAPMGGFSLLSPNEIVYSANTNHAYANGEMHFVESEEAPSRAYLKLWEVLTRFSQFVPPPNSQCIDLGACPGGWTWVLDRLKQNVISIDRSPLVDSLMHKKNINFQQANVFTLEPQEYSNVKYLFCDVISYPEKLYEMVQRWMPYVEQMVCTIKFQKQTDFEITQKFAQIKNAQIVHLYHNKHELTFLWKK